MVNLQLFNVYQLNDLFHKMNPIIHKTARVLTQDIFAEGVEIDSEWALAAKSSTVQTGIKDCPLVRKYPIPGPSIQNLCPYNNGCVRIKSPIEMDKQVEITNTMNTGKQPRN